MPTRTLVVWYPDWPIVAAGLGPDVPAAVVHANRVVACSAAARAEGVRRGLRRRAAQACCPGLLIVQRDLAREARAFERVVVAVEALAPAVDVLRPGLCALATRGPSRYFGGDEALAVRAAEVAGGDARAGVAEGPFAATLAARDGRVVPCGQTPAFLAPHPVEALDRPEITDLLRQLGIHTLGDFAALPADLVTMRFGADGARAHRLAAGLDERPIVARTLPPDLVVTTELDPPVDRVDVAAFAGKALADELDRRLRGHGLACTRVRIEAETEHAEQLARCWRHDGPLTPEAVVERVRWQLDGWLAGTATERPTGGLVLLRLAPDELVPRDGDQARLWGAPTGQPERVGRALARIQGLLGADAVMTAVMGGGRDPGARVVLETWDGGSAGGGVEHTGGRHVPSSRSSGSGAPWPGRLPPPSPATVYPDRLPATVMGADGEPVVVTGRRTLGTTPDQLRIGDRAPVAVAGWAGPWPADERWWCSSGRRRARFQLVGADGSAWLVVLEGGRWWVEAFYD